jgi:hypothetical protein
MILDGKSPARRICLPIGVIAQPCGKLCSCAKTRTAAPQSDKAQQIPKAIDRQLDRSMCAPSFTNLITFDYHFSRLKLFIDDKKKGARC